MKIRFSDVAASFVPSEIRNKLFDNPEVITFAAGKPEPSLFPAAEIRALLDDVLTQSPHLALQYSDSEGFADIRKLIAEQRMRRAGVEVTADAIALTSGSQQGIEFSAKIFVNPGDVILCESPTYVGAINAFKPYRPHCVGIAMDEDGLIPEELEKALRQYPNAKMIYTIPDFQNPTGRTMSLTRRKRLAELGAEYQIPIIEDCPYGDLIYEGERLPAVKSFDKHGWVVFLGSFSKTFCPGLRLGWVCASEPILRKYVLAKQCSDLQCGSLDEMLAIAYLSRYDLDAHIEEVKALYRERRDLMLTCIAKYFPAGVRYTKPHGGFFIWLELNAEELLRKAARDKNVAFIPGGAFFVEGGKPNFIRLSYSFVNNDEIVTGIRRLGTLLHTYY